LGLEGEDVSDLVRFSVLASVAAGAPLCVVGVLAAVARRRKANALADPAFRRWAAILACATVAAWAALAVWLVADSAAFAADRRSTAAVTATLATFALLFVLSWPAMAALERAAADPTTSRQSRRSASLGIRTLRGYLSTRALAAPYLAVTVAAVVVVGRAIDQPLRGYQYFAVVYLCVALVLLLLYAGWLAQTARAPQALPPAGDDVQPDRTAETALDRIRRESLETIHRWQTVLAVGLGAVATTAAFLDWTRPAQAAAGTIISALATLLAVAGCARAIGANFAKAPIRVDGTEWNALERDVRG
jgi:hypothetical protein